MNIPNRIRSFSIFGLTSKEIAIILAAFSVIGVMVYFWFMEQQEPINDSRTFRTVANTITVVDSWVLAQENKDTPVPTLDSLDITRESGVELELTGTANGYCLTGTHSNGDVASTNGYTYASSDRIVSSDGRECVDGKLIGEAVEETEESTNEATEEVTE